MDAMTQNVLGLQAETRRLWMRSKKGVNIESLHYNRVKRISYFIQVDRFPKSRGTLSLQQGYPTPIPDASQEWTLYNFRKMSRTLVRCVPSTLMLTGE